MSLEKLQKRIAANIKDIRRQRGLLQKDFEKAGYKLRHYQKIESGQSNVTLKTLYKLSQAMDVHVDDFILDKRPTLQLYRKIFFDCPFGLILWQLKKMDDPFSLCLYDYNRYGEKAVHRNFSKARGRKMTEIFPLAEEQGLIEIFYKVITTGEPKYTPRLIRYDRNFPLTVFSTKFIKCGPNIGAAIFTDVTKEFLAEEQVNRQKAALKEFTRLPMSENDQIDNLKREVDELLVRLGQPRKYLR